MNVLFTLNVIEIHFHINYSETICGIRSVLYYQAETYTCSWSWTLVVNYYGDTGDATEKLTESQIYIKAEW